MCECKIMIYHGIYVSQKRLYDEGKDSDTVLDVKIINL